MKHIQKKKEKRNNDKTTKTGEDEKGGRDPGEEQKGGRGEQEGKGGGGHAELGGGRAEAEAQTPGGQSSSGAGGMSPPNRVVIKQGIGALDLALSFVAPAMGHAGNLVLTFAKQAGNKKFPPADHLGGLQWRQGVEGHQRSPWAFAKPKKVWIVDAEGQKAMILLEYIAATQA